MTKTHYARYRHTPKPGVPTQPTRPEETGEQRTESRERREESGQRVESSDRLLSLQCSHAPILQCSNHKGKDVWRARCFIIQTALDANHFSVGCPWRGLLPLISSFIIWISISSPVGERMHIVLLPPPSRRDIDAYFE